MKHFKVILALLVTVSMLGSGVSANAATYSLENSIAVTNDTPSTLDIEQKDSITGLTDSEVYQLYEEYLAQQPQTNSSARAKTVQADLDGFAKYAVERGIIEDTPQAKTAITKAVVRAVFKIAANLGNAAGYTTAATLLKHSLQDNPSDLNYGTGTSISNQIKNSDEFKKIISDFKSYVKGKNLSARVTSGSTTLNSTTDLHLAYNKVSYIARGSKSSSGLWTVSIKFNDTYDFETVAWKSMGGTVVTIINNYAAAAQELGAIVPYDVSVTAVDTFYE